MIARLALGAVALAAFALPPALADDPPPHVPPPVVTFEYKPNPRHLDTKTPPIETSWMSKGTVYVVKTWKDKRQGKLDWEWDHGVHVKAMQQEHEPDPEVLVVPDLPEDDGSGIGSLPCHWPGG